MRLGSRPAGVAAGAGRRGGADAVDIERLRAIPWGFAWAQARIELPGWYGLGAAVEARRPRRGRRSRSSDSWPAVRTWPFLTAVVDHAELALARSDLGRRAAVRGPCRPGRATTPAGPPIEAEHERSVRRGPRDHRADSRLLEASPAIARAIELRNPDVDTLSELQVGRLARLRALPADAADRPELERLVRLTVSGVAAGLQVTG